jgi:quinol monooxygenase YgiN
MNTELEANGSDFPSNRKVLDRCLALRLLSIPLVSRALALAPITTWGQSMNQAQSGQIVHWVYEVTIKHGKLQDLKNLIAEMVARTKANEPETLTYDWEVSEDGSTGRVFERYANSEAALAHLATFNRDFAERLGTMTDFARFTIYGHPSASLKKAIAGAKPIYFESVAGFAR